ncbi:MAG: two-component regulator propeller domain-containing protein [Lewinella sp.]
MSILLLVLTACGTRLWSQESLSFPKVHAFTTNTYGGGNQNWDIAQGENGLLYVANTAGVLKYNGVGWTTLSLPGNPTVRAVAVTNNRLYAGGYGEFGYFEYPENADPAWVSLASELTNADRNEEIWNIELLPGGLVAFQSFGRLFIYDGTSLQTVIPPGVMMFAQVWKKDLIVPVTGQGLFRWTAEAGFSLLPGTADLGDQEVVSIVPWKTGLLLGNADGILFWDGTRLAPWSVPISGQLSEREINRLEVLRNGSLAIGTITSGLYIFNPKRKTLLHLDEVSSLSNNTVLSLFQSAAGNLWVGLDRGLDLVDRSGTVKYPSRMERPPGAVYAALQYGGRSYLGTNQGLYWLDTSRATPMYRLIAGTSGQVWELRPTPTGLLCGHNEGTFLIQDTTSRVISERSGGWQTIELNDGTNRLLQATYTNLQLFTPTKAGFETVDIPGFSAPIRHLSQTGPRSFVVLHGSRGGFVIHLSEDYRQISGVDTLREPSLIKAGMVAFHDTVLVQNHEAVYHFREGALKKISSFRGVPLKSGNYCLKGKEGTNEWFVYQPDRVGVYRGSHQVAEIPLRLRYPFPVIIPWRDDKYLFLLEEGFAEVEVSNEEDPFPGLLLQSACRMNLDWRALGTSDGSSDLPYASNDLRFSFALPVFDRPVRYRSRLVGYSAGDWSDWSVRGAREFTNLPAGNYRFEVEANWFGARAERTFSVLPPWYRSKVAYLAYALLLMVSGRLLYRLHLRRLARQARHLEIVRQRELQRERIVARNRELSTDVKRKSKELANTTLTLAKKNEMLLALKEELAKGRNNSSAGIDHRKVSKLIDRNLNNKEDWAIFESHFNEVHEAFLKRLRNRHQELTTGDLKLAAYLRMDLSSKEIAPLLHISLRGVENKRYRLRKKLGLEGDDNLNRYLLEF